MLPAFTRAQLADGVEPPEPLSGPPPPWMASRPDGTRAIAAAFQRFVFPTADMQAFEPPVLFVLGERSHPAYYRRMAERLATSFPDFRLEVFDRRHHFDPPHRAEPERYARLYRTTGAGRRPGHRERARNARTIFRYGSGSSTNVMWALSSNTWSSARGSRRAIRSDASAGRTRSWRPASTSTGWVTSGSRSSRSIPPYSAAAKWRRTSGAWTAPADRRSYSAIRGSFGSRKWNGSWSWSSRATSSDVVTLDPRSQAEAT